MFFLPYVLLRQYMATTPKKICPPLKPPQQDVALQPSCRQPTDGWYFVSVMHGFHLPVLWTRSAVVPCYSLLLNASRHDGRASPSELISVWVDRGQETNQTPRLVGSPEAPPTSLKAVSVSVFEQVVLSCWLPSCENVSRLASNNCWSRSALPPTKGNKKQNTRQDRPRPSSSPDTLAGSAKFTISLMCAAHSRMSRLPTLTPAQLLYNAESYIFKQGSPGFIRTFTVIIMFSTQLLAAGLEKEGNYLFISSCLWSLPKRCGCSIEAASDPHLFVHFSKWEWIYHFLRTHW